MTAVSRVTPATHGPDFRDERSAYPLVVQRAARDAVNVVKKRSNLDSVAWVSPLAAAPAAVGTMAILLKAASNNTAANLKVDHREVTDGQKVIGLLPYETLHGNLQHCSDIGRFAFNKARETMNTISQVASRMISDGGSIEYILDLVDDPDDARKHLKSEMTAMSDSAKTSLDEIQKLTEQFNNWYWVICCLKSNTFDGKGKVQELANRNELGQEAAEKAKIKYGGKEEATARQIRDLEAQRQEAADSVSKAQEEVDRLQKLPDIPEPPFQDELVRAQNAVVATEPEIGLIKKSKNMFFGESKSDIAARKQRYDDLKRQRDEYMANARKARDRDRQIAVDRLDQARTHELELLKLIQAANAELAKNQTQLARAKENLAKTEMTLRRLGEEKMGLDETLSILNESSRQLGELKEQISELVKFFANILSTIKTTVGEDVENFLRPIQEGILTIRGTDVLAKVELGRASRKRIITKALHIQGSFSAIGDITETYVSISDQYIQPAIAKMEKLSLLSDDEWRTQSIEFTDWCKGAIDKIKNEAERAGSNMEPNMTERVVHLHARVLESTPAY